MLLSEILALGSATSIALSSMFIGGLGGRVQIWQLARWQLSISLLLTAAAATLLGGWATLGPWQAGWLAASGFAGISFASTTYFAAILSIGPRLTALLFSLTAPFALALGYIFLGETIRALQGVGVLLVLAGIALAIGAPKLQPQGGGGSGKLAVGIVLGVVTALGQALGSLLARPAMASGVEPFTAMAVRIGCSVIFFWLLLLLPQVRRQAQHLGQKDAGLIAASAFFGATMGMVLLMGALKTGSVGIVATLSSMTPVVILPMVWWKSGTAPAASAWVGAGLACFGTALISLG